MADRVKDLTDDAFDCPVPGDQWSSNATTPEGKAIRLIEHCFYKHPGNVPGEVAEPVQVVFDWLKARYK